jgi:hypothetical protein
MADMMGGFKVMIIVMLFYATSITLITYALEDVAPAQAQLLPYSELSEEIDLEGVSTQVEDSLTRQTDIPVVEVGALVFYSGNILIDLLLNFAYAVPQMIALLIHGLQTLLNIDVQIWAIVQIFASVLITALYFIGLIQLLTGIRSGRII